MKVAKAKSSRRGEGVPFRRGDGQDANRSAEGRGDEPRLSPAPSQGGDDLQDPYPHPPRVVCGLEERGSELKDGGIVQRDEADEDGPRHRS